MTTIDERIVGLKFDNKQFEKGVSTSMGTLERLKRGLNLSGATKGVTDLQNATSRFNLGPLGSAVEGISGKFLALSTVAVTALANITSRAVDAGVQLTKSLTLDPIMDGFREYELQMNSVQTILANTMGEGTNLEDVTGALDELNAYADKTIYNFAEMTRNIGTFSAAGVTLDTSVKSIKGIANLAAISGSSSQQASTAMYQLSQAISTGELRLQDWNSVVNAGMGGKVFQEALFETGKAMGTIADVPMDMSLKEWEDAGNSFRESLQEGWITGEVLTNTLEGFTGDLTDAQLKSMGYSDAQIKKIQEMGAMGQAAATEVKTLTQLIDTVAEGVGSGWAQTWQILFGDFEEAKELWSGVSEVIGGFVDASSEARNSVLEDWKELGGRTLLIESIGNVFSALMDVLRPLSEAFKDVFPPITAKTLYDLTVRFKEFTENIKMGEKTIDKLRRTFRGVFAVIGIIVDVLGAAIGMFADLFGYVFEGSGSFLDLTANVGDFLYNLRNTIREGKGLEKVFSVIGTVLKAPIALVKTLIGLVRDLIPSFSEAGDVGSSFAQRIEDRFAPILSLLNPLRIVFEKLGDVFQAVWKVLEPIFGALTDWFSGLGSKIADAVAQSDFQGVLDILNTAFFGAVMLAVKKFLESFGGMMDGLNLGESLGDIFDGLTGSLQAMQQNLKANVLLKLAAALLLLTVSVVALSMIDSASLTKSLTAITVMFTQLFGAMAIFEKLSMTAGFVKMPILAASLMLLAGAIVVLTLAVMLMSRLSWDEMVGGLTGLAATLGILAGATKLMSGNTPGLIATSFAMILLGTALNIMAAAVKSMSELSLGEMAKGLGGIAGALIILAGFTKVMGDPGAILRTSAAMVVLGAALHIIAGAVKSFASMSIGEMVKGLVGLAGSLVIIAAAMYLMPPHMLVTAASLVVVGIALQLVAKALSTFGGMTWGEIAKGLITLAGSLIIIAGAMYLMTGALPGAAALLVVSAALTMLAPALVLLGSMSWGQIVKGLVALVGALAILALAGLAMTPVVPTLLLLGTAILLLGAGVGVAGAGIGALALGLAALAAAGTGAGAAIVAIVSGLIGLIPMLFEKLGEAIVALAGVIKRGIPAIVEALVATISALLDGIREISPKLIDTLFELIMKLVDTLLKNVPKLVDSGMRLIKGILKGMADNIGGVVEQATRLITEFIRAIGKNAPKVAEAGVDMIIDFMNGIADIADRRSAELGQAGGRMAWAIVKGMANGLANGHMTIWNEAHRLAEKAMSSVKSFFGIHSPSKEMEKIGMWVDQGFAIGLKDHSDDVSTAAEDVGMSALDQLRQVLEDIDLDMDDDFNPTIRPVLDLSDLEKNKSRIGGLLGTPTVDLQGTYARAANIAVERRQSSTMVEDRPSNVRTEAPVTNINMTQNNTSPKALSSMEIYRQTRKQINTVKEVLGS